MASALSSVKQQALTTIDMKIAVASWYDKKALKEATRIVSISTSEPRGKAYDVKIYDLVPGWDLVTGYKRGQINEEEYTDLYEDKITPLIDKIIDQLQEGDVLCCWCKKGAFCHRIIVAKLLAQHDIEVQIDTD